ncbi:MAG: pilus assembly protein [Quadrisphaera sp.]
MRRLRAGLLRAAPLGARGDGGSASVEFIALALVLLVPVAYLVVTLARLQAGAYAASAGARSAARAYVTAPQAAEAPVRAEAALALALTDQGFTPADATAATSCEATGCFAPDAAVVVTVRVDVPLPFVPPLLRAAVPARVPVEATGTAVVDRFAALPAARMTTGASR